MNWKLRLKNKAVLLALIAAFVAFVWQVCGIIGITLPISQSEVIQTLGLIINALVALGIVIDPTTAGIGDSQRAMGYSEPWKDQEDFDADLS